MVLLDVKALRRDVFACCRSWTLLLVNISI